MGSPAGWRCGDCRKQGLEARRGCGWLDGERGARIVWGDGEVVSRECPTSAITGASVAWLELYGAFRVLGGAAMGEWTARDAEAMALLREEWEKVGDEARRQ